MKVILATAKLFLKLKEQDARLQGQAPGFRDKTGKRQGQVKDETGTRQGQDRDKTGTRQEQEGDKIRLKKV